MTQDKPLSFTLRFVLGLAAAGVALVLMNRAAEFIVQLLFAWVIVLSAGPLFLLAAEEGGAGLANVSHHFASDNSRLWFPVCSGYCGQQPFG